jgi:hypothetical protein
MTKRDTTDIVWSCNPGVVGARGAGVWRRQHGLLASVHVSYRPLYGCRTQIRGRS